MSREPSCCWAVDGLVRRAPSRGLAGGQVTAAKSFVYVRTTPTVALVRGIEAAELRKLGIECTRSPGRSGWVIPADRLDDVLALAQSQHRFVVISKAQSSRPKGVA